MDHGEIKGKIVYSLTNKQCENTKYLKQIYDSEYTKN